VEFGASLHVILRECTYKEEYFYKMDEQAVFTKKVRKEVKVVVYFVM
jgi:hypothetical protein